MTVFLCAKCGTELTPDLRRLADVPDVSTYEKDRDGETRLAPSTVPRGCYAVDPEPWGAPFRAAEPVTTGVRASRALLMPPDLTGMVSAGPKDSVIVHPQDAPTLRLSGSLGVHHGCCGPLGTGGRNMSCACGARVATLAADCMGPYELHLDPLRTHAIPTDAPP
ncbi:hypothetical protein [Streptomyces sp. NPDC057695]|uniref:hypothetical protein n=1 Tax=unclassified Streptomyces TaxID=2593676 RepID=UPI00363B87A0